MKKLNAESYVTITYWNHISTQHIFPSGYEHVKGWDLKPLSHNHMTCYLNVKTAAAGSEQADTATNSLSAASVQSRTFIITTGFPLSGPEFEPVIHL